MRLVLCYALPLCLLLYQSSYVESTTYTIGLVVATESGTLLRVEFGHHFIGLTHQMLALLCVEIGGTRVTDVNNERYVANVLQALADIESGYVVLDPPLPFGVNITLAIASSNGAGPAAGFTVFVHPPADLAYAMPQ
jgi:hypothetical protein